MLKDNKYILDEVYPVFPDYLIENMIEEKKDSIIYEFKTSLYSDMVVVIEKVFDGTF